MAGPLRAIDGNRVVRPDHQPALSVDGEIVDGSSPKSVANGDERVAAVVRTVRSAIACHVHAGHAARGGRTHDARATRTCLPWGEADSRERFPEIAGPVEPCRAGGEIHDGCIIRVERKGARVIGGLRVHRTHLAEGLSAIDGAENEPVERRDEQGLLPRWMRS